MPELSKTVISSSFCRQIEAENRSTNYIDTPVRDTASVAAGAITRPGRGGNRSMHSSPVEPQPEFQWIERDARPGVQGVSSL